MYITKNTDEYNDTLSKNNNCTNNDIDIEIILLLIVVIPCSLSFLCLMSLMIHTIIKSFFNKHKSL